MERLNRKRKVETGPDGEPIEPPIEGQATAADTAQVAVTDLSAAEMTDQEAQAILEADLEAINVKRAPETVVAGRATLEDMIAEATEVRRRGVTFFVVPPVIADLSAIIKLVNRSLELSQSGDTDGALCLEVETARRILYVKDTVQGNEVLRTAREIEIRNAFPLAQLAELTVKTLTENGLDLQPGKP